MHRSRKLAVLAFVGTVMVAAATCQPAISAEQTHPISYAVGWPDSINTNSGATAAPAKPGLRMAQSDCRPGCNMVYQNAARQCEAFRMYSNEQYRICMMSAESYGRQCMQSCANNVFPQPRTLCETYPDNPQCQ